MGFSTKQVQALQRNPDHRNVRTREANGRELSYIEGWHAISEANRIFGFDAWNRETAESKCVLARENRGAFLAVYTARVRITVQAHGSSIIREGHGTGEGRGSSPGEAHDFALKAAETDATKRALSTFGNPFGLSLYKDKTEAPQPKKAAARAAKTAPSVQERSIDRDKMIGPASENEAAVVERPYIEMVETTLPVWVPAPSKPNGSGPISIEAPATATTREQIEKSALPIGEPKRLRNREHLRYVASQPCLVCGRSPSQAHHLRFAQPRAMGRKVSDEFTVPLCGTHHHELHMRGNEQEWWRDKQIEPLSIADELWLTKR